MYQPQVSNFMRLFILHRILKDLTLVKNNEQMLLPARFENCDLINNDEKSTAHKIISSLQNYGIKAYMTDHYNEAHDSKTIDLIFNKIILKHFGKEYHQIISYNNYNNPSGKVFNTKVLMCLIFQFVFKSTIDINNICLVSSHWLYHAFDSQSYRFFEGISTYHENTYSLAIVTLMKIVLLNSNVIANNMHSPNQLERLKSQMQRLYNTQSLTFHFNNNCNDLINEKFLSYLNRFNNVEKLDIDISLHRNIYFATHFNTYQDQKKTLILQTIVNRCSDKIKTLKIAEPFDKRGDNSKTSHDRESELPALKLNNLERLWMDKKFFPVIFSNKLKSLTIGGVTKYGDDLTILSNEWIRFMIDNCDCTNIKEIKIINVEFDKSVFNDEYKIHRHGIHFKDATTHKHINKQNLRTNHNNNVNTKLEIINSLNSLAQKLINLKKIEFVLSRIRDDSMYLWNIFTSALESIILTNNTLVLSDKRMHYCNNRVPVRKTGKITRGRMRRSLTKKFRYLLKHPSDDYKVTWDEYNKKQWNVTLYGPQGSPYENGIFKFELEFNAERFRAPSIYVKTPIYHPNVMKNSIKFDHDIDFHYGGGPECIKELLDEIVQLLTYPDCYCFVDPEAAIMYLCEREKFNEKARKVTKQFAI